MQWLRAKRMSFAALALFALALQLVASFGHIHVSPAQVGTRASAALTQSAVWRAAGDLDHKPATASCDICATLQLGGVAQLPQPPALVLPLVVAAADMPAAAADAIVARRHSPAQSRAPPIA